MKLSEIQSVAPFELARDGFFSSLGKTNHRLAHMLTFVETQRYLPELLRNKMISCVVTPGDLAERIPNDIGMAISASPRDTFYEIHQYLATQTDFYWKDFATEIAEGVVIHPRAYVAEKNVRIFAGARIEAGAIVLERCEIGEGVVVRSGTVLGSEGYEFQRTNGRPKPVIHAGGLRLCNHVEVQANCAIDRSIFGDFSVIGEDTKIDNLVHIGHRVRIGTNCLIVGGAIIGGNVVLGNDVWVGPGAVISSGITIGNGARISLGAVVINNVADQACVSGNFAVEHGEFLEVLAVMRSQRKRVFSPKKPIKPPIEQ